MLSLPSPWNFVPATAAFFVALSYLHRRLDDNGIPKGLTRSILVLTLASILSAAAGTGVEWLHDQAAGKGQAARAHAQG